MYYISLSSYDLKFVIVIQSQNYKILVRQRICFTTYLQAAQATITANLRVRRCMGHYMPSAPYKKRLKFLHFEFITVHVTGREIHIIFQFELTLNFRFYS